MTRPTMRYLALGGLAGPLLFASVVIVCAALRPGYDHAMQFISELGATGTPRAALMNFAGFIPSGILVMAFGVSLAALLPPSTLSRIGAGLIVVFGLGISLAGVYSCDPGCPRHDFSPAALGHEIVSITAFVAGIAGIAVWAYRFRELPAWRPLWRYSALSSAAALLLFLMLAATAETRTYTGIWQRLFLTSLYLWCAVVGVRLFRRAGS